MPYWTTDIGGFTAANPDSPAYRELFVRWFEYGTFCPIFRVHGTRNPDQNELWSYGPEAQQILTKFDQLRYRLLPYIYSLAWRVTGNGYTLMRPLVMDFRDDLRSQRVSDQFLFGPSLLVNPVTEPGQLTRNVYLPPGIWYDFWTGAQTEGGHDVQVAAPLDSIPLFVRAGSILPMGPNLEYADQHPADPLEVRIYPGADGDFTLYEDEGDGYRYEKGAYATIAFHWQDDKHQLSIAAQQGNFPGMLKERDFRIVWVGEHRGIGAEPSPEVDRVVHYTGAAVTLQQPAAHK
jgi:alpha-D-xyloside xylohydrolase